MQIYATVRIDGKEYRVIPGRKIKIDRLDAAPGDVLEFRDVTRLLAGDRIADGSPTVEGALVRATLVKHGQEKGVIVFKMKRRRKYQRKKDREWDFSVIKVDDVVFGDTVFGRKDLDPKKIKKAQAAEQKKARAAQAKQKPVTLSSAPAAIVAEEKPRVPEPLPAAESAPAAPRHENTRTNKRRSWPMIAILLLGLAALLLFFQIRKPGQEAAPIQKAAPMVEATPEPADIVLRQTGRVDRPAKPNQPPR